MSCLKDEIREIIEKNTQIKAVSIDIFDTLLFRTVVIPDRVFWYMYRKRKEIFPSFSSVGDWVNSRRTAEKEARRISKEKYGHEEICLEDIYHNLPTAYSNYEEIMQLELDCECELAVLNEDMQEVIQYLYTECGMPVYLVSDMYMNASHLRRILERNGLNLEWINKIYVSSERKSSKTDGGLFKFVLNEENLKPDELFHIGDNYTSDVFRARKEGIQAYYYDLISQRNFRYPFLMWEQELYLGPLCEELFLIRLLANKKNIEKSDRERFFFMLGAMILGPFFTCATEWVLDEAKENCIKNIRPLMREGKFLSVLLNAAKENRKEDISIEPLYISRVAAYSAQFCNITSKEVATLMSGANMTLKDLLRLLNIENLEHRFTDYEDIPLEELKKIVGQGGNSLFDNIYAYLSKSDVLEVIREQNAEKKRDFVDYLAQKGMMDGAITVDVGWNGTTMNAIYNALFEENPEIKITQLLFCSSKNVARTSVDGCLIKGFVGNYGGGQGKFNNIFIPIFEMFSLCEEGPTIGYKKESEKIVPIMDENVFSEVWISNIEAVQRGIRSFQEEFFKLQRMKGKKINYKAQKVQALSMIERLFSQPLLEEVQYLGTAELDQNIGVTNRCIPVLEETLLMQYKELGLNKFYMHFRNRQRSITWYQAMQSIQSPLCYLQWHYFQSAQYSKVASVLLTEQVIAEACEKKIVVVFSGKDTDLAMIYFKVLQKMDQIEGIICADESVCGVLYCGKVLEPFCTDFNTTIYYIPEKDQIVYAQLKEMLIKIKNKPINIFGYYEGDLEASRNDG